MQRFMSALSVVLAPRGDISAQQDSGAGERKKRSTHLLNAPPQTVDPEIHRQPMDTFQHRHQLEPAHLLHLRIRGPGTNRELELSDRDVLETGIFHLFLQDSAAHEQRHAHPLRGRFLVLAPFADVAVARQGVVVGAGVDGEFLGFDPAGGLAVSLGVLMVVGVGL
jgi:hypothetical protein